MKSFGVESAAAASMIHKACFPHDGWDEKNMREILAMSGTYGFMAKDVGFIIYSCLLPQAEIITLAVLPEFRRAGVAGALLAAAKSAAKAMGAAEMLLEVAADNHAAVWLYRKHCFRDVRIRRGYYANGADAICMAVSL